MKNIIYIISIIFITNAFAQESDNINVAYKLNINPIKYTGDHLISNISEQITDKQKQVLFSAFLNKIKTEKLVTSYTLPSNANELKFNDSKDKVYKLNGEYILDTPEGKITTKAGVIYLNNEKLISFNTDNFIDELSSIEFFETWEFNAKTGSFTKEVKQMGLWFIYDKSEREKPKTKRLFSFKTNPYKENVYQTGENGTYTLSSNNVLLGSVSYYVNLSQNSKLSKDNKKIINPDNNNYTNYVQPEKRFIFYKNIFEYVKTEALENNKNIIYDYQELLQDTNIINKFIQIDTIMIEDPVTGYLYETVYEEYDDLESITGIHFTETWYIDINNFAIKKVVHSFSPVKKYRDEYSDVIQYRLKKYFDIQVKNSVKGKISPFFNKQARVLSENLYADSSFIYNSDATKLLPDTFLFIDNVFHDNLLIVGKVTGIDTIEVEDYDGYMYEKVINIESYGLINKKAEIVLPCLYHYILFENNRMKVMGKDDSDIFYIDENGNRIEN